MSQKTKILTAVTISSAGTRQQITTSNIAAMSVIIQADSLNTGKIYIGDSTVTSSNGIELSAGDSFILNPEFLGEREVTLSDIYVDTETNDNIARIQYLTSRGV